MGTSIKRRLAVCLALLCSIPTEAALISRIKVWSDGDILLSSDLNNEFNNVVDGVNSISDANIISGAAIAPSKLSASLAGDGIGRNATTGVLSVNVDNSTIEINSDTLRVKDSGITTAKIADSAVTTAKIAAGNITNSLLGVTSVGTANLQLGSVSGAVIPSSAITTAKIADQAVTQPKLASIATGITAGVGDMAVSNSSGSFSTTTTQIITNFTVNLSVSSSNRPVMLELIPEGGSVALSYIEIYDNSASSSPHGAIYIQKDGTTIGSQELYLGVPSVITSRLHLPCSAFKFPDFSPGAGSHQYDAYADPASGTRIQVVNCKFTAKEI